MAKHYLEPDENLMEFAARFGVKVSDIWNHSNNAELRKIGNPWLVMPGEEVFVPEEKGRGWIAKSGKINTYIIEPKPDIIDVYLGFMDEEVNARLAILIENEDKKSEDKKRPVILIERGKLSAEEPILEWRLGNYPIGGKDSPIRKMIHVSPSGISDATMDKHAPVENISAPPLGEDSISIAPEDLIARMMAIYMEQTVQDDKDLKEKDIEVCKNCGLSRTVMARSCEYCGMLASECKCTRCNYLYLEYFFGKGLGCKGGMPHDWPECPGQKNHNFKEPENYEKNKKCSKSQNGRHEWVKQTGVEFRRAFDILELIAHQKPGKSKSKVPKSEAEIDGGPWLSVVRFDIGPDTYSGPTDIRPPIIVIRTPEMGLQPSLMQPYIEFLFKSISGAASQLAAEKAMLAKNRINMVGVTRDIWEWPLRVFQFGAQGSCTMQEKYSPGKIITVIASLYVGAEIDRKGNVWAVISLCTPGGVYDFKREKIENPPSLAEKVEKANNAAADDFHKPATKDVTLTKNCIHQNPNNPYINKERNTIKEGDTLKEVIEKVYELYKDNFPKSGNPPGAVTLTLSYFGGDEDKNAADNLGIYSVGMEDYHVLRILRSAFCQGLSETTDYPIVLGWRVDRIQCDPKKIDDTVQEKFLEHIKNTDYKGKKPHVLLTAEEYADIIVWGLQGLITTSMPDCARWSFIDYYWKDQKEISREKLKSQFWSYTYFGKFRDWTFLGLRKSTFMVPNPFYIEIATDMLNDLSEIKPGKNNISQDDIKCRKIRELADKVKQAWEKDEGNRGDYKKRSHVWKEKSNDPFKVKVKDYYGPKGTSTKKAAIELMKYIGENCDFYIDNKYLKTWLRAGKWGTYPNNVTAASTQHLGKGYGGPKFDGSCVDRAFYKSCNMMALQTMAGNLWENVTPMELDK